MITGLNSRSRKHNSCFNLVFLYVGLKMLSDSGLNVLVISDLDCFSSLRDFWDRELKDLVNNPLLSSCLLTEYYKLSHVMGWQPFLFVFLSNKRIVGFAPLLRRLRFGFREVANIHQFASVDFFDDDSPAIAESYLRRSLEAIFDIGRHIIAKTPGKGIVEYKEIASALGDKGVITKQLAEKLRLMAGYRNRLVHFYHEVNDKELYQIIKNNLADIEVFVKEMKTFIESYRQNKSGC